MSTNNELLAFGLMSSASGEGEIDTEVPQLCNVHMWGMLRSVQLAAAASKRGGIPDGPNAHFTFAS